MTLKERIRTFEEACRRDGLKITHQRLEIFKELLHSHDHPTVERLYMRLQPNLPTISLDTIYRTLTTLEQYGLVSRVQTVESQARFESKMEEHLHLICKKCGKITDIDWQFFDQVDLPSDIENWGCIEQKNITLLGHCKQCTRGNKT